MNRKKSQKLGFYDHISNNGVVLVDFKVNGSTPCISQRPIIDGLTKQFKQKAAILIVDVDENKDLAASFQITSIPTLIILKDGKEIQRFIGLQSAKTLATAIDKAINKTIE